MALLTIEDLQLRTPCGRSLGPKVNVSVSEGQLLLIQGPNGSGKTTLLRTLLGNPTARDGKIRWSNTIKNYAYLAQIQELDFHIPISLGDVLRISSGEAIRLEQIESFGLLEARHLPLAWNRASGGERKRALLTRIFLSHPDAVILDEPFNHLDADSRWAIGRALNQFLQAQGSRLAIVVSHDSVPELDIGSDRILHLRLDEAK